MKPEAKPKDEQEAADWERHGYLDMKPMTTLDMIALSAWVNVPIEKLPGHPTFRRYPNSSAEKGWARVADAILGAVGIEPISTAPTDGTEVNVWVAPAHGLLGFWTRCAYHPDAGWCADELREVTHWLVKEFYA